MSMPAPNRGELLIAWDETISKEWGMLEGLFTVIVYVVPSCRFNVGPGEVILLALSPYPYVPEPDVTEPAYRVIEVPEVCALVVVAVKVDSKPITSIRVNTKKIRVFIIFLFRSFIFNCVIKLCCLAQTETPHRIVWRDAPNNAKDLR
jgi:hypothetical protein